MGQIIRRIPYKSQYDDDASEFRNDCGPACVAMILNAVGKPVTTNTVFRRSGADRSAYVSVTQMIRAAGTFGVRFEYFYPWSLNDLKRSVQYGLTPITLVHYGAWSTQGITQSSFRGPHFVVIVGYDQDHVYVNDPLWWGTRRYQGEHRQLTNRQFEAAWSTASKDGNRNYSGIYCTQALPVETFGPSGELWQPPEPPPPPFEVEPLLKRQILAWAAYYGVPVTLLESQAVVTAYVDAMGDWGMRLEIHEVVETDTLPLLALRYYGDPMMWEVLVYFNGMGMTDTIHNGDLLLIPEPLIEQVEIPEGEIPTGGTTLHEKADFESSEKPRRSRSDQPRPQ